MIVLGGGVIGLCSAYYALKRGLPVTVIEREPAGGDNCSMGNAGMIVPSHCIPLAAPGMISKGLRWMFNPESPFYIRPRLDPALARWAWLFYRHSTPGHVERTRELLRDLNLESRRLFAELAENGDFGLEKRGMLMLCKTAKGLDEEAHGVTYVEIDAFLHGQQVSPEAYATIVRTYDNSQHKRMLPLVP